MVNFGQITFLFVASLDIYGLGNGLPCWLRVGLRPALLLQPGIPLCFGKFLYFVQNYKNLDFAF